MRGRDGNARAAIGWQTLVSAFDPKRTLAIGRELTLNRAQGFEGRLCLPKAVRVFRIKEMVLQEWSRFLEAFEAAVLAPDEEMPVLLVRDFAGGEESLILLAGRQLDRFEAESPGGWVDYPEADEDRWIFLAGDRSLVEKLGLTLGAN